MSIVLRTLTAFVLFSAICFAQRGAVDVRGDLGWTGFLDESADNHLLVGGSAGFYVTQRLSIRPEFQYLRRTAGSGHYDLVLTGSLAYDLRSPRSRVVPYLIIGPGMMYSHENRFSNTRGFVTGGGGVKIFVTDKFYVAPDFRVGWEPHARFSVGLGYMVRR